MSAGLLLAWSVQPVLGLLAATAVLLVWAARRHPRWPTHRTAAGLAGLAALAVALGSGIDARGDELLSVHMVQHALMALVAAPLLVLAAPVRLALGTLPRQGRRTLARALHSPPARLVSHPLVGLALFAGTLLAVHVPAVYDGALQSPVLHGVEHAALLWSAVALWAPVIAADPLPHHPGPLTRFAVLAAAMGVMGVLGAAIAAAGDPVYAHYAPDLDDQRLAGGIMWIGGMGTVLPAMLALVFGALVAQERRQRVREAAG